MILYNYPQQILRFAQNNRKTNYLGGTDVGYAAISAVPRARSIVILSEAKNLLFAKKKFKLLYFGNCKGSFSIMRTQEQNTNS